MHASSVAKHSSPKPGILSPESMASLPGPDPSHSGGGGDVRAGRRLRGKEQQFAQRGESDQWQQRGPWERGHGRCGS